MKKLLFLALLLPLSSLAQYQFDVSVELSDASKETISLLDSHIHSINRTIDGNVISFATTENYSEQDIDSIFVLIGAPPFLVIKDKKQLLYVEEKAGGNNCELAELLCSNSTVSGVSSGAGTQELNSSNQGCLGIEHQSSWYYVNIQTPGSFNFTINPNNNNNDYDFALWGPFTSATAGINCPPINQPIRCSFAYNGAFSSGNGNTGLQNGAGQNSEGAGGDGFVNSMNVLSGEVYILLIDNFTSSNSGYTLSFGGTAMLGCDPIPLPTTLTSFTGKNNSGVNVLSWTVDNNENCVYYFLQRSEDGEHWDKIPYNVDCNGLSYSFGDGKFKPIINYYRLCKMNTDGHVTIFNELLVSIDNRLEAQGEIVKTINILGQEVGTDSRGVVFDVYENGFINKRISK